MRPLLAPCVSERRTYVELALGWVLREMGQAGPQHVQAADAFLLSHAKALGSRAWTRALERRPGDSKARLLALRA